MNNLTGLNSINNSYRTQVPYVSAPKISSNVSAPVQQSPVNVSFSQTFSSSRVRTSLSGKKEKNDYNEISALISESSRRELNSLLKTGKLLNNNSNDNTTTLDNLHKVIENPRAAGLDKKVILEDIISTLNYPFRITQKFGDIPIQLQNEVLNQEKMQGKDTTPADLNVQSSTCPAASIEFNLAHKMPAEFTRMAAGVTSEKMSVDKKININELSQSFTDTIWMLNEFKTEYKLQDWNNLTVNLKPDRNAIIRARIQSTYKNGDERSPVDVLIQSMFMNVGARNTYDSITDKRAPKYNDDDSGLIDIEKNFAEELATGKGKVCVTYQKLDENGKLVGYECEPHETFKHIQDTLNSGDNVIIGHTYLDEQNNIIGGHEITIIGIETDKNGQKYFICNDTDDGIFEPIKYAVDDLLPRIHHAGIPKSKLVDNVEFIESWKELMQIYKEARTQQTDTVRRSLLDVMPKRAA